MVVKYSNRYNCQRKGWHNSNKISPRSCTIPVFWIGKNKEVPKKLKENRRETRNILQIKLGKGREEGREVD